MQRNVLGTADERKSFAELIDRVEKMQLAEKQKEEEEEVTSQILLCARLYLFFFFAGNRRLQKSLCVN